MNILTATSLTTGCVQRPWESIFGGSLGKKAGVLLSSDLFSHLRNAGFTTALMCGYWRRLVKQRGTLRRVMSAEEGGL